MADLTDISGYLAQQAALAIYPNGLSGPSIVPPAAGFTHPMDVRVYEGWPIPEQLENDVIGKMLTGNPPLPVKRVNGPAAQVSIFPLPGTGREVYQILNKTEIVTPPVFGLFVGVSGGSATSLNNQITINGNPNPGEFVTLVADRQFIFSAGGASAQSILNQLLALAQVKYPLASLTGPVLTVPANYELDVRQGGVGLLGKVTHRQCQFLMVTVWAPNHQSRAVIAAAIDVMLKKTLIVTMPDTSEAKIVYDRTTVSDEQENQSIYRRDLIYDCEYATLETFPGITVTSVTVPLSVTEGAAVPANPTQVTFVH